MREVIFREAHWSGRREEDHGVRLVSLQRARHLLHNRAEVSLHVAGRFFRYLRQSLSVIRRKFADCLRATRPCRSWRRSRLRGMCPEVWGLLPVAACCCLSPTAVVLSFSSGRSLCDCRTRPRGPWKHPRRALTGRRHFGVLMGHCWPGPFFGLLFL